MVLIIDTAQEACKNVKCSFTIRVLDDHDSLLGSISGKGKSTPRYIFIILQKYSLPTKTHSSISYSPNYELCNIVLFQSAWSSCVINETAKHIDREQMLLLVFLMRGHVMFI